MQVEVLNDQANGRVGMDRRRNHSRAQSRTLPNEGSIQLQQSSSSISSGQISNFSLTHNPDDMLTVQDLQPHRRNQADSRQEVREERSWVISARKQKDRMYFVKTCTYCFTHYMTMLALLHNWDVKHCGIWISTATLYCFLQFVQFRNLLLWIWSALKHQDDINHLWCLPDMFIIPGLLIWVTVSYFSETSTACVEDIKVHDPNREEQEVDLLWDRIPIAVYVMLICQVFDLVDVYSTISTYLRDLCNPEKRGLLCCLECLWAYSCVYTAPQTKKQPLSIEEQVQSCKKLYQTMSSEAKETKECVICVEPFADQSNVTQLSCAENHIFHPECLAGWLKEQFTCPFCRELAVFY